MTPGERRSCCHRCFAIIRLVRAVFSNGANILGGANLVVLTYEIERVVDRYALLNTSYQR